MPDFSINPEALLQTAVQHHQAGRLADAEALYRQILQANPRHSDALHLLGVLAGQAKQFDTAISLIRQSLALQPRHAGAYNNLGAFLRETGALAESAAACRQAIALAPQLADAHFNLGATLAAQGHVQDAIAAYQRALALEPQRTQVYDKLGDLLQKHGHLDQALALFRQALILQPHNALFHCHLGNTLAAQKRLDEAVAAFRQAVALNPNLHDAYNNLGNALAALGRPEESLAAFQQALALQPAIAEIHNNYGETLLELHRVDEALAAFRQAVALKPSLAAAHWNLAYTLKDSGLLDEALVEYRHAATLEPDKVTAHNSYLFSLQFHPAYDARAIAQELRRWNERFAQPLVRHWLPHTNDRHPDRPLRIGYVSPDFYLQAECFFTVPLLEHHDRAQFEIHCYASVRTPDAITQRLQRAASVWHDVLGRTDEQLADQIRADRIDILVDLTMHMNNSRLLAFARKPAPVQATWLAYPGRTGLAAMDYRLSDAHIAPPGMDESVYAEQTIRLPDCWVCYDPLAPPGECAIQKPPGRPLTLGCLNNPCKLNDPLLRLWAQVMRGLPDSRLLIRTLSLTHRQRMANVLAQGGIDPARLEFVGLTTRREHMLLHNRIDVALDTLPYNGITTTCDALWMGTPVVTLVGNTAPGRAGKSILTCLGLPELTCYSAPEFVQFTQTLCRDANRLHDLHQSLRSRMEASPLMDAPRFARHMEAAYRHMWHHYCTRSSPLGSEI